VALPDDGAVGERYLNLEQMRVDIRFKEMQMRSEPWKATGVAAAAGAALMGALTALAIFVLSRLH
jgi:hypothetical protein